jgi:hypothetical protein
MMRRLLVSGFAIALIDGFIATPPAAAQQSVSFYIGGFVPRPLDSRGTDDVLFQDFDFLDFDFGHFKDVTVGGEYLVGLSDFFDAGLGIGIYSESVLARDLDFVGPGGSDIEADLKLRIIPVFATIRFLPLGHHDAIEPYIGGGVAIYNWRYAEVGDFVNSSGDIVRGTFEGSDTTVGPVVLGGVRVPIGRAGIGGEIRYQGGKGDLPPDQLFAGPKINLGGFNYLFTLSVRF